MPWNGNPGLENYLIFLFLNNPIRRGAIIIIPKVILIHSHFVKTNWNRLIGIGACKNELKWNDLCYCILVVFACIAIETPKVMHVEIVKFSLRLNFINFAEAKQSHCFMTFLIILIGCCLLYASLSLSVSKSAWPLAIYLQISTNYFYHCTSFIFIWN